MEEERIQIIVKDYYSGGINASVVLATAVAREGGPTWRIYFPWRLYGRKCPLSSRL